MNPLPAPDPLSDLQRSGLARFSPRRWGLPSLVDWWPAYLLVAVLAFLGILVTVRLLVDLITPFAHVLLIAAFGGVLTISLAPLVARLDRWIPRRAAVVVVFFGTLLSILGLAGLLVWQLATEGQRLSSQLSDVVNALEGKNPVVIGLYGLPANVQESLRQMFAPLAAGMAERTAGLALALASSLVDLVLVLVVTFYFLLDERRLRVAVFRTFEPQRRPVVRRVFQDVSPVFGVYVRAQLLLALSIGGARRHRAAPPRSALRALARDVRRPRGAHPDGRTDRRCDPRAARRRDDAIPSNSLGGRRVPRYSAARVERPHAAPLRTRRRTASGWIDPGARARVRALGRRRRAVRRAYGGSPLGAALDRRARVARQTDPAARWARPARRMRARAS